MLHAAVVLFVIALAAAWTGLPGVATAVVTIASVLFVSFTCLTVARYASSLFSHR